MALTFSQRSMNESTFMKHSPVDELPEQPQFQSNSQPTDVKTRKAVFVNGDPTRVLWIGYSEGRCISHWKRREGDVEPFAQTHKVTLNSDPDDICSVAPEKYAVSHNGGDVVIFNTAGEAISEEKRYGKIHGNGDARVLSCIERTIYSGSSSGSLVKVDAESGKVDQFKGDYSGVRSLCSLAGGSLLASGHSAGQLLLWDLREPNSRPVVTVPSTASLDAVTAVTAHPAQANLLALGLDNGAVGFCDIRGAKSEVSSNNFEIASSSITQIKFHPECGEHMISSSADGSIIHWDASVVNQGKSAFSVSSSRISPWLSDQLADLVRLTTLRSRSFSSINGFDISGHEIVAASDMMSIVTFENVHFPIPTY